MPLAGCRALLLFPLVAALCFAQSDSAFDIHGAVLEVGPNTGLAGAQVTVYQFDRDRVRTILDSIVTDSYGAFHFTPTRAGDYYVEVSRPDYFVASQASRPGTPPQSTTGALVSLTKDHPSEELRFALLRFGGIKGKVVDDEGGPLSSLVVEFIPTAVAPVPGLSSQAMRSSHSALTAPDGSFNGGGLVPGHYVVHVSQPVGASGRPTANFTPKDEETVDHEFAPSYWPGVDDRASAATITVDPAGVTDIGTIVIHKESRYRIRLLVQGCEPGDQLTLLGPGWPNLPPGIEAQNVATLQGPIAGGLPCKDLLLRHVRPGTYRLIATAKHSAALSSVVITDLNVRAPLSFIPDGDVLGRVVMASGDPPPPGQPVVQGPRTALAMPDDKGNFTLASVPCLTGDLQIRRLDPHYYLKELRVNGVAVSGPAAPLCGGFRLEIVLDDKFGALTIAAMDGDKAASELVIFVRRMTPFLPTPAQNPRAKADKTGSLQLPRLAPGDYQVLAVRQVTLPEGDDLQQVASELWDRGTNVTVEPGESKSISVKLIDPFTSYSR